MSKEATHRVRVAIVGTPRTGNNWLQNVLSRLYAVQGLSPVTPDNVAWPNLPPECVLILHWGRTAELAQRLDKEGFRVVSLARHPLDVLLSILQFTLREPTDGWLQGEGGGEQAILGMAPTSAAFLNYACGPRARALLNVTCQWWQNPNCGRVRYEDLVAEPEKTLQRVLETLGWPGRCSVAEALAANSMTNLRQRFAEREHHFWQGRPGLWRELLPAVAAERIFRTHADLFTGLGYDCVANPTLTEEVAHDRWLALLQIEAGANAEVRVLQRALTQVKRDLEVARARLGILEEAGPLSWAVARGVKRVARIVPALTRLAKWVRGA